PTSCLAFVIVLDQFPRNLHRGSPEAFRHDPKALGATRHAITSGLDTGMRLAHRIFLYMPLMHSEDMADQRECVTRFEALAREAPPDVVGMYEYSLGFAKRHAEIIDRFGRFPHRNTVLGRASTPEEEAFLSEPMS